MNRQLMQAVLASADDDDDARLVYADWCEDEGDLARARLIRVQIERRRLSRWDVKQIALQVEEEKLIDDHGGRWIAELEPIDGITWTGFERGFVARAEADSFGALCAARDAIVQQTPLEHIKVPWPEDEARAKSAPVFPTLRGLRIERAVRDREPYWLAQSPLLSTLTELALVDGFAEDPGTRAILNSKYLRKLKKLELVRNEVGAQGVVGLIEADLPNLEDLTLQERGDEDFSWSDWDGGLGPEPVERFAEWPGLAKLHRLSLFGNRIEPGSFERLFRSPHFRSLKTLLLEFVYTSVEQMLWQSVPEELELEHVCFSSHMLSGADLWTAPCLASLRRVDLRQTRFQTEHAASQTMAALNSVQSLDLWGATTDDVGGDACRALVPLEYPNLHTLRVGSAYAACPLERELWSWLKAQPLHALILSGNRWEQATELLRDLELPQIERLELQGASTQAQDAIAASPLGRRLRDTGGLRFRRRAAEEW